METSISSSALEPSLGSYSLFRSIGSEPRHLWSQQKRTDGTVGTQLGHTSSISDKSDPHLDQLFVFGYSCKLFRDDRRAQEIDCGQHLIGWNGSSDHLIDRFDVRGYLNDLTQFHPNNQNSYQELTPQELEIERLCDEERFADLKYEDSDDNHEEELKRWHMALADGTTYNQIAYNYDNNDGSAQTTTDLIASEQPVEDEDTDTFKLPSGLSPPEGIPLPKSQKLHNIIEKTASFVSQHGIQMEIVLKTKQSSNKNFDFLSFDSELYPYYKYILGSIKSGKYIPKQIKTSDTSDSEDSDDDHYLHPSLLGSAKLREEQQTFKIPHLLRAPNNNDSYSQLIKSFKDRFPVTEEPTESEKAVSEETQKPLVSVKSDAIKSQSNKEKNSVQTSWSSLLPSPPPEIEQIIEKLAQRVALNGEQFELSIRKLGENRFEFVNPGHIYHAHYIRRKIHHLEENRKAQIAANHKKQTKIDSQTSKAPVSFSISTKEPKSSSQIGTTDENLLTIGSSKREDERTSNCELNAKRMSENALKDKLALALRDKAAKDKQEERKRKAALFLSLLKNKAKEQTKNVDSNENISENVNCFGPELPKPKMTTNSGPLSPTIVAVTSPNTSPDIHKILDNENTSSETVLSLKNYETGKSGSLLPFIVSDKPLKETSHMSPHKHHKSRHSSSHKKSHKTKRSRSSKSRSRSSSRSPSRSRRKHRKHSPKSRSRSRSRSHSRSHKRQ